MTRLVLLSSLLAACASTGVFECERNEQCRADDTRGICEPNGHCSFGDYSCPSGRRFDEVASREVAGTCVGGGGAGCVFDLSIGDASMCLRRSDGELACWGRNTDGQLTAALASPQLAPATAVALTRVAQIQIGERHACIRSDGDYVRCVGKNNAGQLGNDATVNSAEPVDPLGLGSVFDLDVHGEHSCAVASVDGAVACWGRNLEGQLGDGSREDRHTPIRARRESGDDLIDATSVTTGRRHACALLGGRVSCWGENVQGQIGDGTTTTRAHAIEVVLDGIVQLVAGREHTCARDDAGTVWCWGQDAQGQIGDGAAGGTVLVPKRVVLPGPALAIALGHNHSCALLERDVWCWGKNVDGQVANPPSSSIAGPTRVDGFPPAVSVVAGFNNTCVIGEAGDVWCRGSNSEGQLANGQASPTPVATPIAIPVACP